MNDAERRARAVFRAWNKVIALAASACLLALLGFGIGTVPALGPALVPGHGAWRSPAHATPPVGQTLSLAGLASPANGRYPGGQSKDLALPWYSGLMAGSQPGICLPIVAAGAAAASSGAISCELRP